ncbi:Phosphatidylglycerol/phosphatidylinositol transfer protein [Tulasnella sp. 418]|nr:Phosphatidylglycerol/phosphatidylinositol transfer protein [Tulasnella sp. 418]
MRSSLLFTLVALPAIIAAPWGVQDSLQLTLGGDAHTTNSWNFVDCGSPSDVIQIQSLTVSPDPPVPGQNLTIKVKAFVTETIEDGAYADVTVKLGLIKLLHKRFDVCEEAEKNNAEIQCPVEAGFHDVTQTVELPKEIPPAKFVVNVRGYTVDDEDMVCADIKVDFMKRPGGG